ncbi:MAG: ubiquinol-cytochrome c reductase iron-sulfur subunit [Candidatus Wallbacteria bacterium]|nr:ubiquinol-cytochrome c reductase iron-sulfur subunit [Candidatus Wallbacteria bacterium]
MSVGQRLSRRFFAILGLGGLAGVVAAWSAGLVRFLFPRILYEPPMNFVAGDPDAYRSGEVETRWQKDHRVWVVREGEELYALIAQCTHLGCTPTWFADEQLFKCPCHGSNFTRAGDPVAGPAPSPLYRASVQRGMDGQLQVNKAISENRPGPRDAAPFVLRLKSGQRGERSA